jgi:hypothetical protein
MVELSEYMIQRRKHVREMESGMTKKRTKKPAASRGIVTVPTE